MKSKSSRKYRNIEGESQTLFPNNVEEEEEAVQIYGVELNDEYFSDRSRHNSEYYDCGTDKEIDISDHYPSLLTPRLSQDGIEEYNDDIEEIEDVETQNNTITNTNTHVEKQTLNNIWVYAGIALAALFIIVAIKNKR